MTDTENETGGTQAPIGRNEPCPCGSGKKYKRCCGVDAAPKLSVPKTPQFGAGGAPGMPPGFDPSQMDPQMMMQVAQALQRLPRGQVQRLQALMQKAMSGKDVSREAAELEAALPPDFTEMLKGMKLPGMPDMVGMPEAAPAAAPAAPEEMSEEQARAIVAQAAAQGKISEDKAKELLGADPKDVQAQAEDKSSGLGKLWGKIKGK